MKTARHGHACGTTNYREILVVGGRDGSGELLSSTEVFAFSTLEWREHGQLPEKLYGGISVQYKSTVIVLGSKVYQFEENHYEWSERSESLHGKRIEGLAIEISGKCDLGCTPHVHFKGFLFVDVL